MYIFMYKNTLRLCNRTGIYRNGMDTGSPRVSMKTLVFISLFSCDRYHESNSTNQIISDEKESRNG